MKVKLDDILGLIYKKQVVTIVMDNTITNKEQLVYTGECGDYVSYDGKEYFATKIQLFPCELMIFVSE